MKSRPVLNETIERLYSIPGNVPNPIGMPNYCYFRNRCEKRMEICKGLYPEITDISDTHKVNCYLYQEENKQKGEE